MSIDISHYTIGEFIYEGNSEPTEVHFLVYQKNNPIPISLRFKSPDTLGDLIEELDVARASVFDTKKLTSQWRSEGEATYLWYKMQGLEIENVINGAKEAAKNGISFGEYVEMISNVVITGQSSEEVKTIFIERGINLYFDGFADGKNSDQSTDKDVGK